MAYSAPTMATIRNAQRGETRWHISALGKSESLMWSCQVNQALGVDPGVRTFNVDNGALHNGYVFADFETNSGLALYAETVYGTFRVRFKEAVGDFLGAAIEVAENNLALSDGDNIYLYHDYPIFPMFPRIAANGTFYKDYDVAYTDENEDPVPVAVIGPDWAGWLTGASVSAALNGADSYAIKSGAIISTYLWEVEPAAGASITNANIQATTISFTTTGFWWVKLTVTDDNGKSDHTRALFWVHDASYPPIEVGTASWDNGYSSGMTRLNFNVIDGQADEDTLPAEARLLLWSEDYLDGALSYQGGWTGRQMSKWGGYVVRGRLSRETLRSQFEFEAEGPTSIIDQIKMYSVSLSYKANPSTWWQYANSGITVAQAIHHLWRYHSTLINVRPVILPTGNALRAKYVEDFEEDTLFQQANNLAYLHGIYAKVCCNEAGIVYVEQDAQVYDATTAAGVALTDADWFGDMVIEERPVEPVSFLKLSGFSFNGAASTALISKAPGGVAWDRGQGNMNVERQILQNQAGSNVIAGRVFAKENNRYPTVSMELPSVLSQTQALRIVPQQWHEVVIDPADTVRGLDWSGGEDLVVREINCEYVPGRCKKTVTFEPWTDAIPGVTGDYPTEPSDPTEEPIELPPWPPLPPEPTEPLKYALLGDAANGPYLTSEANEVSPVWLTRPTTDPALLGMMVKRGWTTLQSTTDPERVMAYAWTVNAVYFTSDAGKTWSDVTPTNQPESLTFVAMDCQNSVPGVDVIVANGSNAWYVGKTSNLGASWEWSEEALGRMVPHVGNIIVNGDFSQGCTGWSVPECQVTGTNGVVVTGGSAKYYFRALSTTYLIQNLTIADPPSWYTCCAEWTWSDPQYDGSFGVEFPWWKYGPQWTNGVDASGKKCVNVELGAPQNQISLSADFDNDPLSMLYGILDDVELYPMGAASAGEVVKGVAIDLETGDNLYITVLQGGGTLLSLTASLADFSILQVVNLTAAYNALNGYPRTVWQPTSPGYGDKIYVFGSDSLGGGQILESIDAGASFSNRSAELAAESEVAALIALGDGSGQLQYFYAFLTDSSVWKATAWAWTLQGMTPFVPHRKSVSVGYDTGLTALMSNSAAGAAQAATAPQPYITWTDRTGDLPIDGGSCYVEWITP